jgi:hypothetical protein
MNQHFWLTKISLVFVWRACDARFFCLFGKWWVGAIRPQKLLQFI